jgi:hypothetical protein
MTDLVESGDLDRWAARVVRSGVSAPAVFLLELGKPLAFLGSQMMLLWGPIAHLFVDPGRYDDWARGMAERENWEKLIRRIEDLEGQREGARARGHEGAPDTENQREGT